MANIQKKPTPTQRKATPKTQTQSPKTQVVVPSLKSTRKDDRLKKQTNRLPTEEKIDETLEDSFPASDPPGHY